MESNNYPKIGCIALVVLFVIVLNGCEVLLPQQQDVKEEVLLKKYEGIPLAKVLTNVQNKFREAKEEDLYFYSPNNYRAARAGLQAARAYFKDPEKKTYVLKKIYQTEQAIDAAFEIKKIVRRELSEFIDLHNSLVILDAKKTHAREFRSRIGVMTRLIERIEEEKEGIFTNKDKKARFDEDKNEIIADLKDFRLRVVKSKYLNHGEMLIAEAESKDARNIAPVTYNAVAAERQKATAYIENNVENLEGIQQVSKQFEFAAQRLMHITREVFNVLNLQPNTHEEYVLRQEERLKKIADAEKAGDLRDKSFYKQAVELAGIARRIVKQKEDLALQIAEIRSAKDSGPAASADAQSADLARDEHANVAQIIEEQSAAAAQGQNAVVPVTQEGDPEEMRKSIRLLTDQVYQLIIENDQLKGQNQQLKGKLAELENKLTQKTKTTEPKSKSTTNTKNNNKPAGSKNTGQGKKQQSSSPAQAVEKTGKAKMTTSKPAAENTRTDKTATDKTGTSTAKPASTDQESSDEGEANADNEKNTK